MSGRRSPEQVHQEDGHPTPVASCSLCHPEPQPADETTTVAGEDGQEPVPFAVGAPVIASAAVVLGDGTPELVIPERRPRAGQCRNGCAAPGTHNGLCHDCHTRPGRTS